MSKEQQRAQRYAQRTHSSLSSGDDNGSERTAVQYSNRSDSSRIVAYGTATQPSTSSLRSSERATWWKGLFLNRSNPAPRRVPYVTGPFDSSRQSLTEESDPLLTRASSRLSSIDDCDNSVKIASIFLSDYEHSRSPTLPTTSIDDISATSLLLHKIRFSRLWKHTRMVATISIFIAASLENDSSFLKLVWHMNGLPFIVFGLDMWMRDKIGLPKEPLRVAMLNMMGFQFLELLYVTLLQSDDSYPRFLMTSSLKPIALFYVSEKARQAFMSLSSIAPIVSRVLALEILLILAFAAVAVRMYSHFDSFETLSQSWLSLFQLSTTVVNPSMWMPMYEESKTAALFFIPFDATTTLYLHSLVLSVVFQTYIQASTEIHNLATENREETIRLSYQALQGSSSSDDDAEDLVAGVVRTKRVRRVIEYLRPHYSSLKINALMELYSANTTGENEMNYQLYRTKIQQVLNASIRATPSRTTLAYVVEFLATFVALANFLYVILLTTRFQADWFDHITVPVGFAITVLGILELSVRANPCDLLNFTPMTKLNGTFDGIATLAALVSCYGILHQHDYQLNFLLMGRAIDVVRALRFQKIFRDVIQRSGEVIPALAGPLCLLLSCNHLFVYLGMVIWGGAIKVGSYPDITPLYDQNNFNSYWEGMVTMFNVLIINDWHAIAEVYTYASWNSEPYIVYPFFVAGNLIAVNIMLNCVTAFFVGAFVTKFEGEGIEDANEVRVVRQKSSKSFNIAGSNHSMRRISTSTSSIHSDERPTMLSSSRSEVVEFDVYERPTFDKIMRTVAGVDDSEDAVEAYAKDMCEKLEMFEALSPSNAQKLGYLTYCQQSMNRYGNRRFQIMMEGYNMSSSDVDEIVRRLHAKLLGLSGSNGSVSKTFHAPDDSGKELTIKASLIRQSPPVSLLVASSSAS